MTKGIAIETILLLLLGILVVGILVYLLYKYVFNPVLPEQVCRSRAVSWCTLCRNAYPNFSCDPCYVPMSNDLKECADEYFPGRPTDCNGAGAWCAAFIGWG